MSSRRRSREAGFSYIEILVGIVILAIVAGGIAQGLAQSSATLSLAKVETTATKLASAELDNAHRMPYEDVGLVGGSPPGVMIATRNVVVGKVTYKVDLDVVYVDDPALGQPDTYVNYKKVTTTVTPQAPRARPYQQTTIVAPPAIGSIAGKATIIVTVIDALTDEPVVGVPVTADLSTSPAQTRATDSDGKVVFAGLEPSAIPVNDPKYKYRLTVGVTDPWLIHPDSDPTVARQHLAASQTWSTTLKVFKRATILVNVKDSSTGLPITERTEVAATTPGPDVLTESQVGTTGAFTFTTISGKAIQPSESAFTVAAQPDCYATASISRAVPTGYPTNTTETFNFSLARIPSGYLDVTVRSTGSGNPVIAGAQVQVSGGQSDLDPRVRETDAAGFVRFCVPPSGSVSYVVSAAEPGYGAGSIVATINQNQTTPLTMYLAPAGTTGTIRLFTSSSGKLVRLKAATGTYDATQTTNTSRYADFTGLAAGTYTAYYSTGFSGGTPVWNAGKSVTASAGQTRSYSVP